MPTRTRARAAVGRAAHRRGRGTRSAVDGAGPRPRRRGRAGCAAGRRGRPRLAARANRLVGNADGDGALEVTALGAAPALRRDGATWPWWVGAEVRIDGRAVDVDTVVPVAPGQELSVGADARRSALLRGRRRVAIDVDPVFGSRSSDVLTGLGPGPLRAGDVLGIGPPTRPRGRIVRAGPGGDGPWPVRAAGDGGPRRASAIDGVERGWPTRHVGGGRGQRPHGGAVARATGRSPAAAPGVASRGMVTGAVQVPPDGRPVVLLCDHATVGGYPRARPRWCAPISAVLGQLRPGDAVRFEPVDPAEADRARSPAERALDRAVVGWFPVRSD